MSQQDEHGEGRVDRREFLKIAGATGATLAGAKWSSGQVAAAAAPAAGGDGGRKPNVIVILIDDLGYADLGVQGCTDIPTPHIDSLAKSGVRFTSGYATGPICSPSRFGLMTGRYQQRLGGENNMPLSGGGMSLKQATLADHLKGAGYATGCVGKWHLGMDAAYHPMKRGFDEFFGFLHARHSYNYNEHAEFRIYRNAKPTETIEDDKDYLTDAFAREAVSFIERHRSGPFFLYVPFNAVHFPLEAPPRYTDRFVQIKDERRRIHAGMMSALDDAVGAILGKLKEHSLEEDTIVFFTSDHGGPTYKTTASNLPLRGWKAQLYEGGIRVPFMARWPGKIGAGVTYDRPVISLDIMPTVLAAAGVALPADSEGVDLLPHLSGKVESDPHEALCWRYGGQHAVRAGDWKLVKGPDQAGRQLFDLSKDVGEAKDVFAAEPARVAKLTAAYEAWNKKNIGPLW